MYFFCFSKFLEFFTKRLLYLFLTEIIFSLKIRTLRFQIENFIKLNPILNIKNKMTKNPTLMMILNDDVKISSKNKSY
jgi:hypothetical protein